VTRAGLVGCYGLHVTGLEGAEHLLNPVPRDAPLLALEQHEAPQRERRFPEERLFPLLGGGSLAVEHGGPGVAFYLPARLKATELVHPWLAAAAVPRNLGLGRLVLHGGLMGVGDSGIAVVGEREAGKSTLMAAAAISGISVYADDVVVVDAGRAYCGPRNIDLRQGTSEHLEGLGVEPAREGTRDRALLHPVPWSVGLRAIVVLKWGDTLSIESVSAGRRLFELQGHLACDPAPISRQRVLALAAMPTFILRRPKEFAQLTRTVTSLMNLIQ